jgi:hypothetical protein
MQVVAAKRGASCSRLLSIVLAASSDMRGCTRNISSRLSPCADFSARGHAQEHEEAKKDWKTRAKKRPHEAAVRRSTPARRSAPDEARITSA